MRTTKKIKDIHYADFKTPKFGQFLSRIKKIKRRSQWLPLLETLIRLYFGRGRAL